MADIIRVVEEIDTLDRPLFIGRQIFRGETLEMAHVSLKPGGRMPTHSHSDGDQCYYVLAGSGKLHMGDTSYDLNCGKAAFIPKGIEHYTENTGDGYLTYIEARSKEPGSLAPELPH
ncbi:MAG: cupin domain-containing protein [Ardenticatenaceae bacterium]|nr:cupin domain-containing protein [Ardenticatenaceae bacterium]